MPPFSETKRFVAKITADYRHYKAHPDPAMIAAKNGTLAVMTQGKAPASTAKMVAKTAPMPVAKIEESRKLNAELIKDLPIEMELKSQSVAI